VSRYQIKVRASHILVPASKKSLAEQLYQKALHGTNFAALAKKYSTDPGSAKKGGDLGYFARGTMVAPFDQAAFSMKVGQIRLVKSQYGWHIIKLTGRKRMRLTSTEYQQAQQTAYTNWLAKQEAQIHVERFLSPQQLPNVATPSALNNTTQNSVPVPTAAPVATVAPVKPSTTGRSSQSTSSKKKP
jgi:hypothetical protein